MGLRALLLSLKSLLYIGNIELISAKYRILLYVIPVQMRAAAALRGQIATGDNLSTAILNRLRQGCFEGGFMGLRSLLLGSK
jgi:hypothetical protein